MSFAALRVDNNARIASILAELGVDFYQEFTVDGLTGLHGGALRFDFCLPPTPRRPALLLEYQGVQHYSTSFGVFPGPANVYPDAVSVREYQQQIHDQRKQCWAAEQRIPLIQIPPGLSAATERALLVDSLAFWAEQHQRNLMGAEDTWYTRHDMRELQEQLDAVDSPERRLYDHLKACVLNVFHADPAQQWGQLAKRHRKVVRASKKERLRVKRMRVRAKRCVIRLRDPLTMSSASEYPSEQEEEEEDGHRSRSDSS
jgi:phage tail protein X